MDATMMMLGLAALVGVIFLVLFMSGEMKNKSTFSANPPVAHQGTNVARASLDLNSGSKGLFTNLFGKMGLSNDATYKDVLYAEGGAYENFDVPYGNDERSHLYADKSKKLSGTQWTKAMGDEDTGAVSHVKLGEGHRFAEPYAMNRHQFTKQPHSVLPHSKMGNPDLVSNVHTRHPAAAGH